MEQSLNVIPSSELDHVTGGRTKEPSPSGELPVGGGAGGWSMSKDELAKRHQYCDSDQPGDDPIGFSRHQRQKECDTRFLPNPKK